MNSRLDEMQAAILRAKLAHLEAWNEARRQVAAWYAELLPEGLVQPIERAGCEHVYHLYVVRVPDREVARGELAARGVGTGIHYPVPIHLQPAYAGTAGVRHDLSRTEAAAGEILSLPMHPHLSREQVEAVAEALRQIPA